MTEIVYNCKQLKISKKDLVGFRRFNAEMSQLKGETDIEGEM